MQQKWHPGWILYSDQTDKSLCWPSRNLFFMRDSLYIILHHAGQEYFWIKLNSTTITNQKKICSNLLNRTWNIQPCLCIGTVTGLTVTVSHSQLSPFGICLPGTELLQSPFRMEFSMGSCSRQYERSLRRYCRFLRSYRRSLWRCHDPWGYQRSPIVARLSKHHETLLNIVKHHETHVKQCDTS